MVNCQTCPVESRVAKKLSDHGWPLRALAPEQIDWVVAVYVTIPFISPLTSPVNLRLSVQFPWGMTGDGDATVLTVVESQAARTMRATMPTTRSMCSNVSRGAAPRVRLGTAQAGHALPGGGLLDRRRGRHRGLAGAPRGPLRRAHRPRGPAAQPPGPRAGGAAGGAREALAAGGRLFEPVPPRARDRAGHPRRRGGGRAPDRDSARDLGGRQPR